MYQKVGTIWPSAGALLGFAARLASVLAILAVLDAVGLLRASDTALHAKYVAWNQSHASTDSVILVEADRQTLARWGTPPWSWEKIEALYQVVSADGPRAVAVAEPELRFLPRSAPPPSVQAAISSGRFIVPGPLSRALDPALDMRSDGPIDGVRVRQAGALTLTGLTAQAAGLKVDGDVLPVAFARGGVATLPAHRVAAGELPRGVFTGKIVLFGLAPELSGSVPTLAGALSPARVQALALGGLVDGTMAPSLPAWLRFAVVLLLAMAALLFTPRVRGPVAPLYAGALALLVLAVDFMLFRAGIARVGASTLLLAIGAGAMAAHLRGRALFQSQLARQKRALGHGAAITSAVIVESEQVFWQRVGRMAQLYVGAKHAVVAELPASSWEVVLRGTQGNLDAVAEARRDVRAEPYRQAYLTRSAQRVDGFVTDGLGLCTLIVPLLSEGRVLGFWMLSFGERALPGPTRMAQLRELAQSLAVSIERRALPSPEALPWFDRLVGRDPLLDELSALSQLSAREAQQDMTRTQLGSELPCGVVVTTLLGELCSVNGAMRKLVADAGIPGSLRQGLCGLLTDLLELDDERVGEGLRGLLFHEREHYFRGRVHDFVLSRSLRAVPGSTQQEHVLVLWAVPRGLVEGRSKAAFEAAEALQHVSWEPRLLPAASATALANAGEWKPAPRLSVLRAR